MERFDQSHGIDGEQLEVERQGLAARIGSTILGGLESVRDGLETARRNGRYYAALFGATAAGVVAGNLERTMIFPDSVVAESVPVLSNSAFDLDSPQTPWAIERRSYGAQASDAESDTNEQSCDTALAEPAIVHPLHMSQAGIRPYTGWRHPQAAVGSLGYPGVSCVNDMRAASGRIQSLRDGHWGPIWGQSVGSWAGSEGGVSRIIVQPGHADPGYGYLFNDCIPGKGFHPVRIVLELMLKNRETKAVTGEKQYILNVPVNGNCKAALRSKQIAQKQMEHNYGV
jgi:hypothetical protein